MIVSHMGNVDAVTFALTATRYHDIVLRDRKARQLRSLIVTNIERRQFMRRLTRWMPPEFVYCANTQNYTHISLLDDPSYPFHRAHPKHPACTCDARILKRMKSFSGTTFANEAGHILRRRRRRGARMQKAADNVERRQDVANHIRACKETSLLRRQTFDFVNQLSNRLRNLRHEVETRELQAGDGTNGELLERQWRYVVLIPYYRGLAAIRFGIRARYSRSYPAAQKHFDGLQKAIRAAALKGKDFIRDLLVDLGEVDPDGYATDSGYYWAGFR